MADWPPAVGDLVRIERPDPDEPYDLAIITMIDRGGWYRLEWPNKQEGGAGNWYPPSRIVVISKAYKKDEESFKKDA